MLKFLIGPILLCAGYGAGSYYGSDAEQLVHKPPSLAYAAVERALANVRQGGTTFFDGGTPVPYELHVDHELDQKLIVTPAADEVCLPKGSFESVRQHAQQRRRSIAAERNSCTSGGSSVDQRGSR